MDSEHQLSFARAPEVVWEPKEDSGRNMKAFMKKIQNKYNVHIGDYWDIYDWSVENKEQFWAEIWEDSEIVCSKPYKKVIDLSVPMHEFQDWFSGARLNFAENLLRYRDDHVALIVAGEDKETRKITYAAVYEEVKLYAAALRKHGIKKGDRVSCFMSNREEAIFAMLAAVSLGAVWMGALPLMGSQAVLNRFKQVEPVVMFTVDRFQHDQEERNMLPRLKEISENLPSLQKIIIAPSKPNSKSKDISNIRNSCFLNDFLESGKNADGSVPEMIFEQVPFTHPVFLCYTSGTTGLPKALVHTSCGLLCIYRDFRLHSNTDRNSCWLSMSPVGWATWNMITSLLFLGIRICVFEGVPFLLSPTSLWDMVDEFRLSHLLITPSILDEMEKRGYLPSERHDLSALRFVMSGGTVVKSQNFDFFYEKVKSDALFAAAYGSTEMMGIVMSADETLRVHRCEIAAPALGTDVRILNESGESVRGEIGDIVIYSTAPNLPEVWGDTDRAILKKNYYEMHPGKFAVNDLGCINPSTRGITIHGRSDETLKPRGCRFGSSEIYNIVDAFPEIRDSLCVSHYNRKKEERAVLFLKMKVGHPYNQSLIGRIRAAIATELSVRHVPEVFLEVKDIPYNMNGKKMEIIVKKIINKLPCNVDTVMNPDSLVHFQNLPELGDF